MERNVSADMERVGSEREHAGFGIDEPACEEEGERVVVEDVGGVPGVNGEWRIDDEDVEVDFVADLSWEAGEEWRGGLGVYGTGKCTAYSALAFDG